MVSENVVELIKNELEACGDLKEDIESSLVDPESGVYEDMNGRVVSLWLVIKKNEYAVVYDERKKSFGVAFRNIFGQMIYIGAEGSLPDAYQGMVNRERKGD
ncbi:MAG: hypothetical protein ACLFVQ_14320 [Chitinispirillaceae bacterium]